MGFFEAGLEAGEPVSFGCGGPGGNAPGMRVASGGSFAGSRRRKFGCSASSDRYGNSPVCDGIHNGKRRTR